MEARERDGRISARAVDIEGKTADKGRVQAMRLGGVAGGRSCGCGEGIARTGLDAVVAARTDSSTTQRPAGRAHAVHV